MLVFAHKSCVLQALRVANEIIAHSTAEGGKVCYDAFCLLLFSVLPPLLCLAPKMNCACCSNGNVSAAKHELLADCCAGSVVRDLKHKRFCNSWGEFCPYVF